MRATVAALRWRNLARASVAASLALVIGAGTVEAAPAGGSAPQAADVVVPAVGGPLGGTPGVGSVGEGGSARYTIPLQLLPGRGGFAPELSLTYSSDTSDGLLGVGFGLTGLSQISRCAKTVAEDKVALGVRLDGNDRFCLDGQKLVAVKGTYGGDQTEYRTKRDTHVRVTSYRATGTPAQILGPTHFTVEKPDGTVQHYGLNGTTAAAYVVGGHLVNVTWAIQRAEDLSHNTIVYKYGRRMHPALSEVEIERWIDTIEYGYADTLDRRVDFGYEDRPDKRFGFAYGQQRESRRRLKTVQTSASVDATSGWQQSRKYTLSYETAGVTQRSRLAALKECGVDDNGCKRPTIFKWTNGGAGFAPGVTQGTTAGSVVPSSRESQLITADLNGDGRTDIAWPEADRWKYVFAKAPGSSNAFAATVDADGNGYGVGATAYPIDYDLNGAADLLPREVQNHTWRPVLTRADGTVDRVKTDYVSSFNQVLNGAGAMTGDFDGDGYQDVLEYRLGPNGQTYVWSWRRRSGTVNALVDSANPYDNLAFLAAQPVSLGSSPKDVVVVDLDGDGRDEVVSPSGARDLASGSWVPADGPGADPFKLHLKFVDLNGDGLLDVVADGQFGVKKQTLYYKLNRGDGSFALDAPMNISSGGFAGAELVDFDGDGRQELLVPRLSSAPSTSGPLFDGLEVVAGVFGDDGTATFTKKSTTISFMPQSLDSLRKQGTRVVDADGNGLDDVLLVDRPEPGFSGPVNLRLFPHLGDVSSAGDRPDMLHRVYEGSQAPTGALEDLSPSVTFRYASLTDETVYDLGKCPRENDLTCLSGGGTYVVKQMRRDAGISGSKHELVSNYFYKTGRTSKSGRSFLGFTERKVITLDTSGTHNPVIERSFYSNTQPLVHPQLDERWVIHQLPNARQSLQRTVLKWKQLATASPETSFRYASATESRRYEFPTVSGLSTMVPGLFDTLGKQSFDRATETVLHMDKWGNARDVLSTSEGNGHSMTKVVMTPDIDETDQWLVNRPKQVVTKDSVFDAETLGWRDQTRTIDYVYVPDSDLLKQSKTYGSGEAAGRVVQSNFEFDVSGNVVREVRTDLTTGQKRETKYSFDQNGYPAFATSAAGHVTRTVYDPVLGGVVATVDANGLRTDHTFDTLGRLVKTTLPSGHERQLSYGLELVGSEYLVRTTTKDGTGAETQVVSDRAGRAVTERFKGFDGKQRQRERTYDPTGLLTAQTTYHPVGAGATDKTTYAYDDLGRRTKQVEPGNAESRWTYAGGVNGMEVTHIDTRGTARTTTSNHRGETVLAVDGAGTAGVETRRRYRYGPFGTLLSTQVDGVGASRSTFAYDDQGAVIASDEPERGKTTSTYNGFGEMVATQDAEGRQTAFEYDVLGRLKQRTVKKDGVVRSSMTNVWDKDGTETRNGLLLRTSQTDLMAGSSTTQTSFDYDSLNRIQASTYTLPLESDRTKTESLTFGFAYDAAARVTERTYPRLNGQTTATRVAYDYGSATESNGALRTVRTVGADPKTLWTAKLTDEQDRLVGEETGDGVASNHKLDWRGAVTGQTVSTSTADVQPSKVLFAQAYGYDTEGNLLSRTRGGVAEKFTYDGLGRVASVAVSTASSTTATDSFAYDKLGSITTSKRRGTYTYNSQAPTQVASVTGGLFGNRAYKYDAVGNQVARPDGLVTYNDYNLPASIASKNGTATTFLYYPSGARARKSSSTGTVTYVPDLYERHRTTGQTGHRFHVPAGGRAGITLTFQETDSAPTAVPDKTLYTHGDHLGSTALVTANAASSGLKAQVVEERSYDVFGKPRSPDLTLGDAGYSTGLQQVSVEQGYTGHDDDRELGLVNMRGRIYDPELGRFLTADPKVTGANATQAWNRYTYVSNRPLSSTDPDGFEECADCPWVITDGAGSRQQENEWMQDDAAFFYGGAAAISPLNDNSVAHGRILRELDRWAQFKVWQQKARADQERKIRQEQARKAAAQAEREKLLKTWKEHASQLKELQREATTASAPLAQQQVCDPSSCSPDTTSDTGGYCSGDSICTAGPAAESPAGQGGAGGSAGSPDGAVDVYGNEDGAGGAPGDNGRNDWIPSYVLAGIEPVSFQYPQSSAFAPPPPVQVSLSGGAAVLAGTDQQGHQVVGSSTYLVGSVRIGSWGVSWGRNFSGTTGSGYDVGKSGVAYGIIPGFGAAAAGYHSPSFVVQRGPLFFGLGTF